MSLYNKIIEQLKNSKTYDEKIVALKLAKKLKSAMQIYKILEVEQYDYAVNNPDSVRSCKYALNELIDVYEFCIAQRDGKDLSKWMVQ